MTTTSSPNHHAHHAPFAGPMGVVAALSMSFGRDSDAELAAQLTHLAAGETVVDIGCGPGAALRHATRMGATAIGVEPAAVMRRFARVLARSPRATVVDGSAEALPLDAASADVIWSIAAVHHWRDVAAGLSEARRVLVPGGQFLALERRTNPGAKGHASHGWNNEQCDAARDRVPRGRVRQR